MKQSESEGAGSTTGATEDFRLELIAGIERQLILLAAPPATSFVSPTGCSADRWWWRDEDGTVLLKLYFRDRPLAVNGMADTAVLGSLDEAAALLHAIRDAVLAGRLDQQLDAASRT